MKLKPFAVKLKCPVCNGTNKNELISKDQGFYIGYCPHCNHGSVYGTVLAPSSWDGVSEIEWPPKDEPIIVTVLSPDQINWKQIGNCGDCRWWAKNFGNKCSHLEMLDYLKEPNSFLTPDEDFGCIFFERKG